MVGGKDMDKKRAGYDKERITILNPRTTPPLITLIPMAPRLDTLDGKTIYIVDVNFQLTEPFYIAAKRLLTERYPKVNWVVKNKIGSFFDDDPDLWTEIKRKGHGAIVGPGHMDTLGPAVVGWCAELEKLGVPAVPLICAIFPELEKRVAYLKGMPDMRMTFIPYEIIGATESACRKILESRDPVTGKPVIEEMIDILTRPPTAKESRTGTIKRVEPRLLKKDTRESLRCLIVEKGWTDYLPAILPTEEKVAEMLKGTSHEPDEIVGKMPMSGPYESLEYSVEQVAVNAVMAGVRPEHFPVVLAIASTGETSLWSSVTSQTRMVVVNGPIREEIKMNSGIGALGPFNEANAVIGRSWTFISKNLGGIGGIPKINYLGAFGNGLNYNNLCFAENEEGLPQGWKPLHVQKGYQPRESAVSIFAGFEIYSGVGPSALPNHENIKNRLAQLFTPSSIFYRGVGFGLRAVILVTPQAAKALVKEGFKTKEELSQWLAENTFTQSDESQSRKPKVTLDIHLDIIVVGGTTAGFEIGNLHYVTTASVDKWR
jgi:hypothetical protein